jgi:hypothetical protein
LLQIFFKKIVPNSSTVLSSEQNILVRRYWHPRITLHRNLSFNRNFRLEFNLRFNGIRDQAGSFRFLQDTHGAVAVFFPGYRKAGY